MTELKVDTITDAAGTGKPDFEDSITIDGATLANTNTAEYNSSSEEPTSPKNGSIWWDSENEKVYIYANSEFKEVTLEGSDTVAAPDWQGARGLFGGYSSTEIQYITIASPGNATDFGDLSQASIEAATGSNGSRIVFAGGSVGSNSSTSNVIDYVTSSSTGNATDFGDLTQARFRLAGASNGTYSLFAGGDSNGSTKVNTTDRITVATTGNATDFGDMQSVRSFHGGASDATRAIFLGGNNGLWSSEIDYFTFATASNATDFGDTLESEGGRTSGTEDGTYAVFVGAKRSNVIQYITVQTTGNAADFGDMTVSRDEAAACADGTYGVFAGGYVAAATNVMDYITIASTGNATDFGDLISATRLMQNSGASGAAS